MPFSLSCFIFTAGLFVLQAFPYTGVFLMLVAAPLWSVISVNLGFAALALEALTGRVRPAWIVLPLAWFGGYWAAATESNDRAAELDAALRKYNAGKELPYDAAKVALTFDGNDAVSGGANHFVAGYDVPVAYQAERDRKTVKHKAHRIGGASLCTKLRGNHGYRSAGIHSFGIHEGRGLVRDMCGYVVPEEPALPMLRVTATRVRHTGWLLPYTLDTVTLDDPVSGRSVDLRTGQAEPLTWLPMPAIGCALISSTPEWKCMASFMRGRQGLGGVGAYGSAMGPIATALGLEPAPASTRRAAIEQQVVPAVDGMVEDRLEQAEASLRRLIEDPAARIGYFELDGLWARPDILARYTQSLAAALPKALDLRHKGRDAGQLLQRLIAKLPADDFAAVGATVLRTFDERPALDADFLEITLAARLGETGASALPFLERMLAARPLVPKAAAIEGLCRVGAPAAGLALKIAEALQSAKTRHGGAIHAAAYIALLRIGRPDLLAAYDPDPNGRYRSKDYERWRTTVTPESPPEVCSGKRSAGGRA